jgi:hypothetical protein
MLYLILELFADQSCEDPLHCRFVAAVSPNDYMLSWLSSAAIGTVATSIKGSKLCDMLRGSKSVAKVSRRQFLRSAMKVAGSGSVHFDIKQC